MMNNCSYNNKTSCLIQSKYNQNYHDVISQSSRTLNIIRSIVDELYQINKNESLLRNNSKEKRVRFTFEEEESILSESPTVVCCLDKGRLKVDCSISTNDLPSIQCECATQTMDMTVFTNNNDLDQSISHLTLSTTSLCTKSTSLFILNHSVHSYQNSHILPLLSTAHQLLVPSEGKHFDICQEQTLENYNLNSSNSSIYLEDSTKLKFDKNENIVERNIKVCTCFKRKLSDTNFSMNQSTFSDEDRSLEELYLSSRSLQSMHNDGLFYIHDLVSVFLQNTPQFYQILVKHYHVSKKLANLITKIMQKWWKQ